MGGVESKGRQGPALLSPTEGHPMNQNNQNERREGQNNQNEQRREGSSSQNNREERR